MTERERMSMAEAEAAVVAAFVKVESNQGNPVQVVDDLCVGLDADGWWLMDGSGDRWSMSKNMALALALAWVTGEVSDLAEEDD